MPAIPGAYGGPPGPAGTGPLVLPAVRGAGYGGARVLPVGLGLLGGSGRAMFSSGCCSAHTPKNTSAPPRRPDLLVPMGPQFAEARDDRQRLLSAEVRAGQQKYADIENAAAHLHGLLHGRRAGNR
ncbi:hypothetical protein ACN6LA_007150 [Streptomyces sp. SAS_269]|uniref:hypothetical protein n=1 Tax=Streptomyces sp. SAS_269 TaxID=3412749 RepID=UPI00403C13DB